MVVEEWLEFIQKLIHAPEKVGKGVIAIAKASLCMIVASKLFEIIVGPYHLIDLSSYSDWQEFVISGRILICLLLLATSYFALFEVLSLITSTVLSVLQKLSKPGRLTDTERKWLGKLFNKLELLHIDTKKKGIRAAKNTNEFHKFLIDFNSEDARTEIASLQNSFVSKTWHTYIVFLIYYYTLYSGPGNNTLSTLIIIGAILLTILYLGVSMIIYYLQHNGQQMIQALESAHLRQVVETRLQNIGNSVFQKDGAIRQEFGIQFSFKDKTYNILYRFKDKRNLLSEIYMDGLKDYILKSNEPFLLITNQKMSDNAKTIANNLSQLLLVIEFVDESDLVQQIENQFSR